MTARHPLQHGADVLGQRIRVLAAELSRMEGKRQRLSLAIQHKRQTLSRLEARTVLDSSAARAPISNE